METVLITGASRGIGLELTREFLKLGYNVISTYRDKPSLELSSLTSNDLLTIIELEITDASAIEKLVVELSNTKIDILVNNAGVIGSDKQDFETINADDWLETFNINTIAPLMVSRALLNNLKLSSNPRIISVSSQMASLAGESLGMFAYRSSKAALNKTMQVLALELSKDRIIVCPIHPGWVKTDMGGADADISVNESAMGIVQLARNLTLEQSGRFLNWQQEELAW